MRKKIEYLKSIGFYYDGNCYRKYEQSISFDQLMNTSLLELKIKYPKW